MQLVSVIIPVYNTRLQYLRICIDSLLRQTYKNIELIIVDDGSDKLTAECCDELARDNSRIIVIHKTNGGVSSARNIALESTHGEYISFVDSDDWVDNDFIELLVDSIEQNEADLSIINLIMEKAGTSRNIEIHNYKTKKISKKDLWKDLLYSNEVGGYLCNKLFKKELIKEKLKEKLYYSEDFVFTAMYAENVKSAVFVDRQAYHYRQAIGNVTSDFSYNNKIFSLLDSYEILEELYRKNAPDEVYAVRRNRMKIALNLRARYKLNKVHNDKKYYVLKNIINDYMKDILIEKRIKISDKVNMILTYLFPVLMFRIKNLILGRTI